MRPNHNHQKKSHGFRKYRAAIQYVGTRYHGWQIQRKGPTIQGVLNEILSRLAGQEINAVGASRTDAGVHALGQVAHFLFPEKDTIPDLRKALNALLPWDIRIKLVKPVNQKFHAQKDAVRKRYTYQIYIGEVLPPFLYKRAHHVPRLKRFPEMAEAARVIEGKHDFTGFAASTTTVKNNVRTIYYSRLTQNGNILTYSVEANGFLHHMIRNIVGTLLVIGDGKAEPGFMEKILEAKDRNLAGPTAKPHGLVLKRIWY